MPKDMSLHGVMFDTVIMGVSSAVELICWYVMISVVEHMARTVWHDIQIWCRCLHTQLPHVCHLGLYFSRTCINDGPSLCTLCLWLRHSRG